MYGKTWKWLSNKDQQPTWQSLKNLDVNMQILYNPGIESF